MSAEKTHVIKSSQALSETDWLDLHEFWGKLYGDEYVKIHPAEDPYERFVSDYKAQRGERR